MRVKHARRQDEAIHSYITARKNASKRMQKRLLASSKRVLLTTIDFKAASVKNASYLDNLKCKYPPLVGKKTMFPGNGNFVPGQYSPRPAHASTSNTTFNHGSAESFLKKQQLQSSSNHSNDHVNLPTNKCIPEDMPKPKLVLSSITDVVMNWPQQNGSIFICKGLDNLGNTCYMNSVLQAICHTPPLVNFLYCKHNDCPLNDCFVCVLKKHIARAKCSKFANSYSHAHMQPNEMFHHLPRIWGNNKKTSMMSQEDAMEFLLKLLQKMHSSLLAGKGKLDIASQNTTVLNRIFTGYFRSQVVCTQCHTPSNTYESFLTLSLDIRDCGNISQAIQGYTRKEFLHGDNCYKCNRCKRKVTAHKRFTIAVPPNVLIIHLKRFTYNQFGAKKLFDAISFPEKLDIKQHMSIQSDQAQMYKLYGVVCHEGQVNFGHYYSYVRASNLQFHQFNDSQVTSAPMDKVLNERSRCYLLWYIRTSSVPAPAPCDLPNGKAPAHKSEVISTKKVTASAALAAISASYGTHGNVGNSADHQTSKHESTSAAPAVQSVSSHVTTVKNGGKRETTATCNVKPAFLGPAYRPRPKIFFGLGQGKSLLQKKSANENNQKHERKSDTNIFSHFNEKLKCAYSALTKDIQKSSENQVIKVEATKAVKPQEIPLNLNRSHETSNGVQMDSLNVGVNDSRKTSLKSPAKVMSNTKKGCTISEVKGLVDCRVVAKMLTPTPEQHPPPPSRKKRCISEVRSDLDTKRSKMGGDTRRQSEPPVECVPGYSHSGQKKSDEPKKECRNVFTSKVAEDIRSRKMCLPSKHQHAGQPGQPHSLNKLPEIWQNKEVSEKSAHCSTHVVTDDNLKFKKQSHSSQVTQHGSPEKLRNCNEMSEDTSLARIHHSPQATPNKTSARDKMKQLPRKHRQHPGITEHKSSRPHSITSELKTSQKASRLNGDCPAIEAAEKIPPRQYRDIENDSSDGASPSCSAMLKKIRRKQKNKWKRLNNKHEKCKSVDVTTLLWVKDDAEGDEKDVLEALTSGPLVMSWCGERKNSGETPRKRQNSEDSYNEEYDQPKVKKSRHRKELHGSSSHKSFQSAYENKYLKSNGYLKI